MAQVGARQSSANSGAELRNVDKRPYPAFVKPDMHNRYFTSLKAIVHSYNTRDPLSAKQISCPSNNRTPPHRGQASGR
jgi:cytochrome c peroxidase